MYSQVEDLQKPGSDDPLISSKRVKVNAELNLMSNDPRYSRKEKVLQI